VSAVATAPRPPVRRRAPDVRRWVTSYVMLAPALVLFGVFVLYPLVGAVRISLTNSSGIGQATFVGLGNYRTLLSDDVFWKAALNTVLLAVVSVPVSVGSASGWPCCCATACPAAACSGRCSSPRTSSPASSSP